MSNGVAGAVTYIKSAIAFAAANPGRTGFYYAGAYYGGTNVHVSVLDALVPNGFFNTNHNSDPIHIDPATTPQVPGPTDATMSGWIQPRTGISPRGRRPSASGRSG